MSESFLHYIWQCQYFNKEALATSAGEEIRVFKAGILNTDAGPDFSEAKIRIGNIEWAGNVEIHINSSDWISHKHNQDNAYENVILHVVWNNDKEIVRKDGSSIPTVELKEIVEDSLIRGFKKLINSPHSIPCSQSFSQIDSITRLSMLDKALMQRLETKAEVVSELVSRNKGDWEETFYQTLARNFGFKVNADPFFQLAKSLPYKIIQKQSSNLHQIEALLFGQAGMLETKTKDEYHSLIYREYQLLKVKYSLATSRLNAAQWKFLRLRPANFPTLRIAQFAALLFSQKNIFSKILELDSYQSLKMILEVAQSEYWQIHYRFGKKALEKVPCLGESSFQNILINSVVPFFVAYGKAKDDTSYLDRAMSFLEHIPAEKNKITRAWGELGISVKTSFDSQALIEQYNNFCQKRQCLNCAIGASLLKPAS